jgi:carbon monoxide dehydrogenase subunit G
MDMKGEFKIPVPQDVVWRGLNDPEILKASIPGCEELVRESDTRFKGKVFASVGPVKARFGGEATLSDIDPPNGYVLTGNGSGGPAGMAKGSAAVRLRTDGAATILEYEVKAQVAGKLAQIGSRLIDMAAKKMADDFFGNFARLVGQPTTAMAVEVPVSSAAPAPAQMEAATAADKTISPVRPSWLVWGAVALIAIIVIAVLWMR